MPEVAHELYRLITASGTDAITFLQGQLTQDLLGLDTARSLPAAWCDARGRVLATMRLLSLPAGIGLVVPESAVEIVMRQLSVYRLRADVEFAIAADEWPAFAVDGTSEARLDPGADIHTVILQSDPPVIEVYGHEQAFAATGTPEQLTETAWRSARIQSGLVDITADTSRQFTPHMLNLDLTGAISFEKGCYTGQEVVARTENLGRSRRRLLHYRLQDGEALVGQELLDGDNKAAVIVNASGRDLLAVAPLELRDESLSVDGVTCEPVALPYAIPG